MDVKTNKIINIVEDFQEILVRAKGGFVRREYLLKQSFQSILNVLIDNDITIEVKYSEPTKPKMKKKIPPR